MYVHLTALTHLESWWWKWLGVRLDCSGMQYTSAVVDPIVIVISIWHVCDISCALAF